jgi:mannose-6-phosphate isomerase
MFIDAGVIHAYTSGFGVEIMAASDNVLRAGLTPKHVDIPELLEVTNFTPMPPPQWAPSHGPATAVGAFAFSPPVEEFELMVADVGGELPLESTPQVVLCLDGQLKVTSRDGAEDLQTGAALYVGAEEAASVSGRGRVAIGRTP